MALPEKNIDRDAKTPMPFYRYHTDTIYTNTGLILFMVAGGFNSKHFTRI